MTSPATFWNFELTWKIFFCSCISTFTLGLLEAIAEGTPANIVNAGAIKFANFDPNPFSMADFPFFLIMGVFGGILGACFVATNYYMGKLRKKYLTTRTKKILETSAFVLVTATIMYFAPMII